MKEQVYSDCCSAAPKDFNNDCDSTDIGICPDCGDHCEFIAEEQFEERSFSQEQIAAINRLKTEEPE